MSDVPAIMLVSQRIVEAYLLGILISGCIYICLDLIFGERGDEGVAGVIESLTKIIIIPIAFLVFINKDAVNTILWILVACVVVAASIFAFLNGPMKVDDRSKKFWILFILLYSSTLFVLLKELMK